MENRNLSPDALMPPEMATKAEQIGVSKAKLDTFKTAFLAVLAGAFIAFGAVFSTLVTTGSDLSYGITKLLGGLAFSLGLILVVVGGAELFTGNNLITMAWAGRKVRFGRMMRNWTIVYFGNMAGAFSVVVMIYLSGHALFGSGQVGTNMLNIANHKCQLGFMQALILGILCNILVCLAIWLCYSARSVEGKILAIIFPITAFVAAGFEHSVANMYFIPMGLIFKAGAPETFWATAGLDIASFGQLNLSNYMLMNLIPVSLGNIIGGAGFVGLAYWSVYLRKAESKGPDKKTEA